MKVKPTTWRKAAGQFLGNECSVERNNGCMQRFVNQRVSTLAKIFKLPRLLTLDAHFVKPEAKMVQDILLQNGNKDGWKFSTSYHQQDTEEAWATWQRHQMQVPELTEEVFVEAVENNQRLVDMVEDIKLPKAFHLPEVEFPIEIRSDPSLADDDARLMRKVMRKIVEYGRLPSDERRPAYLARLKEELDVIARNPTLNFLPYFDVIDEQICGYARSAGELVGIGRGSAAGCLLAYLLKITHLDPIEWDLSFPRFLSLGRIARGKFPDIDLDFGDPKVVVEYLAEKYGDKFARICTTGTMKPKNAIKDVARILLDTRGNKETADYINKVCLTIDNVPQGADTKKWLYGYENDEGYHAGHLEQNETLQAFFAAYPQIKEAVDKVLDVPRSIGRHASAYCISDVPLTGLVPMCEIKEEICTQFTMGPVEKLGLIKMDFLGLNTLKDISGCLKKIKERHGLEIDVYQLDHEPIKEGATRCGVYIHDDRTFDRFCQGRNETVFQFKSAIATNLCKQVKPRSLLDLSAITANGRPGTMYALMEDGKTTLIDSWIARRQGREPITYPHPELEDILSITQGTWSYQEQIMAAFVKCCGFSEERADEVRETIGKKKLDQMQAILPEIRQNLSDRGWNESQIESFVSLCVAASSYSFNKSHSICYAYTGYICQFLKTNFPLEWWASVLNNSNLDDLKDAAKYVREIVESPDVNKSHLEFYIIDEGRGKLLFPLNRVKNVRKAGAAIEAARTCEGNQEKPFESMEDFFNRVDKRLVNKRIVMSLIWSGAFDALCGIGTIIERNDIHRTYHQLRKDKKALAELKPLTEAELLTKQIENLAIGEADFCDLLRRTTGLNVLNPGDITEEKYRNGDRVRVGGLAERIKAIKTKTKGEPMAFIDMTNESSSLSVTVFPKDYPRFKPILKEGAVLLIEGSVNIYNGKIGLIANDITRHFDDESAANESDDSKECRF